MNRTIRSKNFNLTVIDADGYVATSEGKATTRKGRGRFVAREARPAVNRALSAWKDLTAPRPVVRTGIPATGV